MSKLRFITFMLFLSFVITACVPQATMPLASQDLDMKAKSIVVPNNKALLYAYRPSKMMFGGINSPVIINGEQVASFLSASYVAIYLEPGTYTITNGHDSDQVRLNAFAGKTYYLQINKSMTEGSRYWQSKIIPKSVALEELKECKLVYLSEYEDGFPTISMHGKALNTAHVSAPPAVAEPAKMSTSDVDNPPTINSKSNHKNYAIVIGIENYRQKLPKADYAVSAQRP